MTIRLLHRTRENLSRYPVTAPVQGEFIMADWNASLYLKFEDQRTRPPIDLLARVPLPDAQRCVDLGCGPGNSTELLVGRYPDAQVTGIDTSEDMLAKARQRLPRHGFEQADIARWQPPERYSLIFANAALQWVPDHAALLPRLISCLEDGGCLAVQMPDNLAEPSHELMRKVAEEGPWAGKLRGAEAARETIGSFEDYYGWLTGAGCAVDLWRTTYLHPLKGPGAIVEWFRSTGLRPYIDPLEETERQAFLDRYRNEIARAYPTQADGTVLLRFPRLFFVARKT
jgi:trans-aconitate 2-methyltransferase